MAKTPSFIEMNGGFITKPSDIANYFNNYFLSEHTKKRNAACEWWDVQSHNRKSYYVW